MPCARNISMRDHAWSATKANGKTVSPRASGATTAIVSAKSAQRANVTQGHRIVAANVVSGTPPASHFPSKHLNPRWSSYRVCFSCEAKKQCLVCHKSLTRECFSAAAWKCKQDRRKCLTCQRKTRGFWTCAGCQQRKQRDQYRTFLRRRPSGEDGHQMCDACYTRQP